MSERKSTVQSIWREYAKGKSYNNSIDLYTTVKTNENMFVGNQWEGLKAPDVEKPTLNFIKRVVTYFVSMIVSDDIGIEITPFLRSSEGDKEAEILRDAVLRVMERNKIKAQLRTAIRNCAVDGDACLYFYFDTEAPSGQLVKGDIVSEVIDNTNVIFGNPYVWDVQKQPYLILVRRRPLQTLQAEAKRLGCADWEKIRPDSDSDYVNEDKDNGNEMVTELLRFSKVRGKNGERTVHFSRSTENVMLKEQTDTGYTLYPLAYFTWETVKNSYHGVSPITYIKHNQIAVNRLWAMVLYHCKNTAFPKIVYDKSKFPEGWSNAPGRAIAMTGNVNDAFTARTTAAEFSSQVLSVVDSTISMTRDFLGASDAALGNVKAENTSAIIAVQKASSAPLELQRQAFYQFAEDCVRVIADIMVQNYGTRIVQIEEEPLVPELPGQAGAPPRRTETAVDFGKFNFGVLDINVSVGQASYWSEMMQLQTLDNLFASGVLSDAEIYIESIPDGVIRNKSEILTAIRKRKEEAALMQQIPPNPGAASANLTDNGVLQAERRVEQLMQNGG